MMKMQLAPIAPGVARTAHLVPNKENAAVELSLASRQSRKPPPRVPAVGRARTVSSFQCSAVHTVQWKRLVYVANTRSLSTQYTLTVMDESIEESLYTYTVV